MKKKIKRNKVKVKKIDTISLYTETRLKRKICKFQKNHFLEKPGEPVKTNSSNPKIHGII